MYGLRLVPSAFGYKELSGNPASLKGAQHCRAEVFLKGYGWVAMDPADVAKVMRLETPEWIKNTSDPVVAPVNKALFGGWEGNWMAYNMAHDVALPESPTGRSWASSCTRWPKTAGERLRLLRAGRLQVPDHGARDQGLIARRQRPSERALPLAERASLIQVLTR